VLFWHVDRAHEQIEIEAVTQLTVDETSVCRGHDYVTVVCEPGQKARGRRQRKPTRVLFVAEGRDSDTLRQTREFLERRGVKAEQIQEICTDMSVAYIKGIGENFQDARLVFDYFHIVSLITQAVDKIRRRESQQFPDLLKGTRYLWLKRAENLSEEQVEQRSQSEARPSDRILACPELHSRRCSGDSASARPSLYPSCGRTNISHLERTLSHWAV
jgi:transposase